MGVVNDKEQMERALAMIALEKESDRRKARRKYMPEIRKLNRELAALNK